MHYLAVVCSIGNNFALFNSNLRIFDDNKEKEGTVIDGATVYHTLSLEAGTPAIVAIGSNATRKRVVERFSDLKLLWTTYVHPAAVVDSTSVLGSGSVVMAGAIIQPGAEVGNHVIVNTRCSVDHDCRVAASLLSFTSLPVISSCSPIHSVLVG